MVAQETSLLNAFETTLSTTLGASGTTVTLTAVTDSASNNITAPCYLVIEPDSATNREYVLVSAINIGTKTITLGDGGSSYRYLTGSSATSGLSHASGATIRYVPMAQHIEDINDRVDTIMNSAGTAVNTSGLVKDEDNMSSDSATHLATQQSIKKYVDDKVTAEDLDVETDSGNIDIDLDSEALTIAGGEGIDTSATGTTVTIAGEDATTSNKGVASFSSDNFSVSSGAVTIKDSGVDLTAEVTGTLPVANGGTGATTLTDGGVLLGSGTGAITATAVLTNGQLLIGDGTGDPTVGTLTGGTNVTVTNGAGSITIAATDTNTTYTAGDGLDLSGTEFSTDLKSNGGLAIESTELAVDLGASSITGTLAVDDGGTGQTSYTNGQLLIGNTTGNTLAKGTLTAGSNVSITNGSGSITIAATDTNTTYTAGDGLDLSGTEFSTDLKANGGLVIESTELAMDLGASSITGTLDESDGGTGLTGYTAGDILYASGTDTLAKLAKGSADEVLTMNAGATAPEWAAATTGDITGVTAGTGLSGGGTSGDVTLNVASLAVAQGGTGATSFDDKAVIITQDTGTDTLASAVMDANGELLIGGTSGPAVATLTAGSNITITNADGAITIAAAGGDVTASSTTTFTNKTIDADGTGNSISNIDIGNMTSAVVVTESDTIAGNDNDTTLPTSAAVKGYVDAQGFADIGLIIALG